MPPTRPKGIVIGAPAVTMPLVEEEEDEPLLGGLDLTPLSIDIPLVELSEEEQLAFAVRASNDTYEKSEQPRWQVLFVIVLQVLGLVSFLSFFILHVTYLSMVTLMIVFT